jgi:hypothetical protein
MSLIDTFSNVTEQKKLSPPRTRHDHCRTTARELLHLHHLLLLLLLPCFIFQLDELQSVQLLFKDTEETFILNGDVLFWSKNC